MTDSNHNGGFSLIELMVAVGIVGIIVAIGIPIYTGYISTAREGVMKDNIETIRAFEEEYRLRERRFISGEYDPANPDVAGGLKDCLGWEPRTSDDDITYVVSCGNDDGTAGCGATECTVNGGYTVTATDSEDNEVSVTY